MGIPHHRAGSWVAVVRRSVIEGEDLDAEAELAKPSPCDTCPLRLTCATERLACLAFVRYVNGTHSDGWRRLERKTPTRALFELAMDDGDLPPELHPSAGHHRQSVEALERAQAWIGLVVSGRVCVAVDEDRNGDKAHRWLVLQCPRCENRRRVDPSRAVAGAVPECRCIATASATHNLVGRVVDGRAVVGVSGGSKVLLQCPRCEMAARVQAARVAAGTVPACVHCRALPASDTLLAKAERMARAARAEADSEDARTAARVAKRTRELQTEARGEVMPRGHRMAKVMRRARNAISDARAMDPAAMEAVA